MQVIESINEMQSLAMGERTRGRLIGFVPTMGFLHEGHLSLIDLAREKCDLTVVSIFVNPAQFAPNEDFDSYPRDTERDLRLCRERGADIVFMPSRDALFPKDYSTFVTEETLSEGLCGISRPQFFRGVCTVVAKLFNIVRPDVALFGQKDAQQAAVIRKMVADLNFPVDIEVGPTVRESDGLALSSRNAYLSTAQREDARVISQALFTAAKMVEEGQRNVDRLAAEITHLLSQKRRVRVIYVEIVDRDTMRPVRVVNPGRTVIAVAAWVDEVRLIDNVMV